MPDVFVSKNPKKKTVKKKYVPPVTRHRELSDKSSLPGHTKNPVSAFCYYPDGINFVGTDDEEKIILLVRRHPITNVGWIFVSFLLIFTPLVFLTFGLLNFVPGKLLFLGFIFWYLITFAFTFEQFITWFFNVNIITDERVFDVDFINLVYREITDAEIGQIQDVTVRVGSVIRTIFDFGDVLIQTAAEVPELEFEAVPHPDRIAQILRELEVEEEQERIEGRVR